MNVLSSIRRRLRSTFAFAAILVVLLPSVALATTWERLAGNSAYDTMSAIVRTGDTFTADDTDTVIVASGDGYWDALSASGLAGRLNAPVLITPSNSLCDQAKSELQRLKPSRVVIVGGTFSVSDDVKAEIAKLCPTVERVSGASAADTAVAAHRSTSGWASTAIVASSDGYWDALSIAPYAFVKDAPIFLTSGEQKLSDATVSAIKGGGFSRVIIVGGNLSVSTEVEGQLSGISTKRLAGKSALDTSADIARWEIGENMGTEGICVADGRGYWDALTGAAFAGRNNAVLVLANNASYQAVDAALGSPAESAVRKGYVLGGRMSVTDFTLSYLRGEFTYASQDDSPDTNPSYDQALVYRGSLDITNALYDSFAHGTKTAQYQKYIVLHDTEELLDPMGIVDLWLDRNDGEIATHFVVGRDGSVVQCVPLDRIAYHAGDAPVGYNELFEIWGDERGDFSNGKRDYGMNYHSVGIELCHVGTTGTGHEIETDYPEAQLRALDRLIAYIDAYYGFESGIIDHKAWTPGNPDCSKEFEGYLENYQLSRTHDGKPLS